MGLGKDLQGMANKLEATVNKGKAGLGLGNTHTLTPATTPDYSPQPDTAILTNDHAALSFEEMEWWRIMEQRKPAKLLRSKFLPQDNILLALRTAREMSHAWHRDQLNSSDDKANDEVPSGSKDSTGWDVTLLIKTPKTEGTVFPSADADSKRPGAVPGSLEAAPYSLGPAPYSRESFCLHQAPCVAPPGLHHSRSFWNMASLDSAFKICSNLAAMQQSHAELNILDLSVHDCGATEYVLTHGGARVQSAQVMSGEAVQKLQSSASNVAGVVQALVPSSSSEPDESAMQPTSAALRTHVTNSTPAQPDLPESRHMQAAVAEPHGVASLSGSPAADSQELVPTPSVLGSPAQAAMADAAAVTHAAVTDSTHVQTAPADCDMGVANQPAAYSLDSYEGLKASLKAAHLVIGSLGPNSGQGQGSIARRDPGVKGRTEGQRGEGSGQAPAFWPQEGDRQHEGVMEAEYADDYRARLLWECAVALSCLQTGTAWLIRHVIAQHDCAL